MRIYYLFAAMAIASLASCGETQNGQAGLSMNSRFFTVTISAIKGKPGPGYGNSNTIFVCPQAPTGFCLRNRANSFTLNQNQPQGYSLLNKPVNGTTTAGSELLPASLQ